jgi:hypothetical protein
MCLFTKHTKVEHKELGPAAESRIVPPDTRNSNGDIGFCRLCSYLYYMVGDPDPYYDSVTTRGSVSTVQPQELAALPLPLIFSSEMDILWSGMT